MDNESGSNERIIVSDKGNFKNYSSNNKLDDESSIKKLKTASNEEKSDNDNRKDEINIDSSIDELNEIWEEVKLDYDSSNIKPLASNFCTKDEIVKEWTSAGKKYKQFWTGEMAKDNDIPFDRSKYQVKEKM